MVSTLLQPPTALAVLVVAGLALAGLVPPREPLAWVPPRPRARAPAPLFVPGNAAELLEGPARDAWQRPAELVRALRLRPGQQVADIGAGSGYLLPYLSAAVGPGGLVYAQEIQAAFLPELRRRAAALGNVRVVLGTAAEPGLPVHSVDVAVLLTVYHEVEQPVQFLRTLRRIVRPDGRLAIIDFDAARPSALPVPGDHQVWEGDVVAEARAAGWLPAERHELIESQFYRVFRPAPAARL